MPCHLQPPKFEFYDPQSPIYTSPRFLPPAKIVHSKIADAIVSHGAFLEECSGECHHWSAVTHRQERHHQGMFCPLLAIVRFCLMGWLLNVAASTL